MTGEVRGHRLGKLKKHWRKATPEERRAFIAWLGPGAGRQPIAAGRYLTAEGIERIRREMDARDMDLARLNAALGLEEGDMNIARALVEGMPLRLTVIAALDGWLNLPPARDGHNIDQ